MVDGFVPLNAFLCDPAPAMHPETVEPAAIEETIPPAHTSAGACACAASVYQIRRFQAALAEALDAALDVLLRDLASDVLARELALAPAEVAAIAARALERYADESPVRVRAHPDETQLLDACGVPIVADSRLRRGDVEIDLHAGTIDATLGARLLCVLDAHGR